MLNKLLIYAIDLKGCNLKLVSSPAISVLIPVYNGLPYIQETIQCLMEQTFSNFEVLLIDDHSTDNSYNAIENQILLNNRFKLMKMPYKAGNAVRVITYGLQYCLGKYFFYMSQDDIIDKDCLDILFQNAEKYQADAAIPDMEWYHANQKNNLKILPPKEYNYHQVYSGGEKAFLYSLPWYIHGFYLRRMDLLNQVGYDDTILTGDECTSRKYLFFCKKIVFCSTNFYYRQDNPFALTKKFNPHLIDEIHGLIQLLYFMKKHNMNEKEIKALHKSSISKVFSYRKQIRQNMLNLSNSDLVLSKDKLYSASRELLDFSFKNLYFAKVYRLIFLWLMMKVQR